jgi:hypothetical protein
MISPSTRWGVQPPVGDAIEDCRPQQQQEHPAKHRDHLPEEEAWFDLYFGAVHSRFPLLMSSLRPLEAHQLHAPVARAAFQGVIDVLRLRLTEAGGL